MEQIRLIEGPHQSRNLFGLLIISKLIDRQSNDLGSVNIKVLG